MVSLPSCSSQFICTQMWDHLARLPGLPAAALLDILSAPAASLFLLPVWMNVSSLTPRLLSFHTVQFSGSSGWFYFFQICVVLLSVVRGSKVYLPTLPTLPSRPEVHSCLFFYRPYLFNCQVLNVASGNHLTLLKHPPSPI